MTSFLRKCIWLFRRRRKEDELQEELRFHLNEEIDERRAHGMAADQARWAAGRDLGNIGLVKENTRAAWGWTWAEQLARDVRFGARALRKSPGFTLTAIATLALGIGINATVFTVAKAALFAGFPLVDGNDRILYLSSGRGCCVSYPDFEDWRAQAKSFQGMAVVRGALRTVSVKGGFAETCDATEVSADTFRLVGRKPMLGRDFEPSDDKPGAPPVTILTYGFWERRFGKDPEIVGQTIRMNGAPATVIGTMPRGFSFPQKQDLWVPMAPTPEVRKREVRDRWFAFGRLADGATIAGARAEMETIGRGLGSAYPLTNQGRNLLPFVQTFNEFFFFGNENEVYWSMWGAVGFVLLIACANLANLMLARAIGKSREVSVRMALGAGRWRIVRQLLIESAMLSAAGAAPGWWIVRWGVRAYELADRGPGRSSWRILDYTMDYRVLGYIMAISIGTALFFGLAPALRLSKGDVNAGLKEGGRGTTGGGRGKRLSALLVTAEISLAVVLLSGAGVTVRSFLNVYNADLGVKTANVLTMVVSLPQARYGTPATRSSFYARLIAGLDAIPGVESAALASRIPTDRPLSIACEIADTQGRANLAALVLGPAYFRTLGAGVRSGREFNEFDGASAAPVAIVNERFASTHWPGENPLGKLLRLFDGKTAEAWRTVVGVAPDIAQGGAFHRDPLVYLPYLQRSSAGMEVLARTRVAPASLVNAFRREVQAIDADLPIFGPLTLDERLRANYWSNGLYGVLFLIFAAIALLLASIGLYAVMAHSVGRRTQEIGVRMAIGATAGDIRALVFRQGMLAPGIGLAIGLLASLAVNRVLESVLVQVSPTDPVSLAIASAVLIPAAALGCLIPARRAMRVDPVVALRHE